MNTFPASHRDFFRSLIPVERCFSFSSQMLKCPKYLDWITSSPAFLQISARRAGSMQEMLCLS